MDIMKVLFRIPMETVLKSPPDFFTHGKRDPMKIFANLDWFEEIKLRFKLKLNRHAIADTDENEVCLRSFIAPS